MAAGDLTCSVVGTYATIDLAVAAINDGNDALVTDHHDIVALTGTIPPCFKVIKYARAAA